MTQKIKNNVNQMITMSLGLFFSLFLLLFKHGELLSGRHGCQRVGALCAVSLVSHFSLSEGLRAKSATQAEAQRAERGFNVTTMLFFVGGTLEAVSLD